MFCAKSGAEIVSGCEMFGTLAEIACKTVFENDLSQVIEIIHSKSTDFESEVLYDIIVSELLDSSLLGESVISSHSDAIQRLMNKSIDSDRCANNPSIQPHNDTIIINASDSIEDRILPHSSKVYATLIESDQIKRMHSIDSIPISNWSPFRDEYAKGCQGGFSAIPIHWNEFISSTEVKILSNSENILEIQFFQVNSENESYSFETDIVVNKSGVVHAVLVYWDLFLLSENIDPKRLCKYSTNPFSNERNNISEVDGLNTAQNYQDHWLQMIYPLPDEIACVVGDILTLKVTHDAIKMWINVERKAQLSAMQDLSHDHASNNLLKMNPSTHHVEQHQCECGWHLLNTAERFQMLNSHYLKTQWSKSLDFVLNVIESSFNVDTIIHETSMPSRETLRVIYDISDGSTLSLSLSQKLGERQELLTNSNIRVVSRESKQLSYIFYNQLLDANSHHREVTDSNDDIDSNNAKDVSQMMIWDGEDWYEVLNFFSDVNNTVDDVNQSLQQDDYHCQSDNVNTNSSSDQGEVIDVGETIRIDDHPSGYSEATDIDISAGDYDIHYSEVDVIDIVDSPNTRDTPSTDDLSIICLISDCFQYQLHSLPLLQAMSFYYQSRSLQRQLYLHNINTNTASLMPLIIPYCAYIMIAPIELIDLKSPHGPVGHVNGIKHESYDNFINDDWFNHLYPYKLGNYRKKLLSKPICVTSLNYCDEFQDIDVCVDVPLLFPDDCDVVRCDGVAIWVDYCLVHETMNNGSAINIQHYNSPDFVDDFPLFYNVTVKFLKESISFDKKTRSNSIMVANCKFYEGDRDFKFSFDFF